MKNLQKRLERNNLNNVTIKKVNSTEKKLINEIISIHLATFEGFFLTFMGAGFLRQMYLSYTEHAESDIYVASNGEKIVGFLASSENMSGLYKFMIKRRVVQFAWYSFFAFCRKPKVFMRLVRAFLKPGESKRTEKYVELASIGIDPNVKSQGVGSMLIDALKNDVDFTKFEYITLETDAFDNEIANKFYLKNGFRIFREYKTHEGRSMYEYRYEGDKNNEKSKEAPLHIEYSQEGK